jgi:hypothetical protein
VVNLLRQIEVAVANGKTTSQSCKEALITEQTYYRWRKKYSGLQVDQARRLKELEQENAKLKSSAQTFSHIPIEHELRKVVGKGCFGSGPHER